MAESAKPTLTSILEYLHLALRYIASGFVAVGVYIYLYKPTIIDFKDMSGFLIFVTATIGIITYGLHFATFDKVFYGWSIIRFLKKSNNFLPKVLKKQIVKWQRKVRNKKFKKSDILKDFNKRWIAGINPRTRVKRYILFALANQTYLRSISKNDLLVGIQNQVERRLALLNFLYCSFYQIVIITFYFGIGKINFQANVYWPDLIKILVLLFFAVIILFSAIRFNWRICSREMWLIQNFPQKVKDIKQPAK